MLLLSATITIDVPYRGGDGELDVEVRGWVSTKDASVEFLGARYHNEWLGRYEERSLSDRDERRACVALLETAWAMMPEAA